MADSKVSGVKVSHSSLYPSRPNSQHSMLSAVQSLLRSGEEAMGTGPLVRQVATATSVLPTNPALHRVALGVIAGAYHFHLSQLEQVCTL